ncbi:MAG: malonyl-[acyl-carrier protein] O-methyltransferase BioC, partial [Gammaproteobacteria bacterium]
MPTATSNKELIRRHFDRAAKTYRGAAILHREVAERMLERLDLVSLKPGRVLDVGCGPGIATND